MKRITAGRPPSCFNGPMGGVFDNRPARAALAIPVAIAACSGAVLDPAGRFEPACIAFEGDTIALADGRFVWDRFTDQIPIGPDGNPADPFPAFPKRGTYRVDDDRVTMIGDGGVALADRYLHVADGRRFLLTPAEHADVLAGGPTPDCALKADDGEN